jgi:hypothetical protein
MATSQDKIDRISLAVDKIRIRKIKTTINTLGMKTGN